MDGLAAPASSVTLGRYELLFRFAAGGMAEVHAARALGAEGFARLVAVKRMLPTLSDDPKFVEMFLDEAKVAANVHSRHVVSTLDLGRASDGSLYIVMDLIRGLSLNRLVRLALQAGELLPVPVLSEILTQTAQGLHDAHEAKAPDGTRLEIVHRDVSPQNVLLDRTGAVRLTDFGVARAVERHSRTETGELRGKVAYFAPEQMSGGVIDRRTDVFALGVVAHEMITGKRLFRAENAWLTLQQVANAEIPRVDAVRDEVPASLADAVERALNRDPDGRFPTAAAFGEAVREAVAPSGAAAVGELVSRFGGDYLDGLESRLREAAQRPAAIARTVAEPVAEPASPPPDEPAGASTTAEVPDVAVVPPAATPPPARSSERRPPLWAMVVVPCVLAAAAAFVGLYLGGNRGPMAADADLTAAPPPTVAEPTGEAPPVEAPDDAPVVDSPVVDSPVADSPVADNPAAETPHAVAPDSPGEPNEVQAAAAEPVARPTRRPSRAASAPSTAPSSEPAATEPEPERPATPAGSSVLMGADIFEQELEGR